MDILLDFPYDAGDPANLISYVVFALPILLAAITSRRYNFIFGAISFFTYAYFILFVMAFSGFVKADFISSIIGLNHGLSFIHDYVYVPTIDFLRLLLGNGIMNNLVIAGNPWPLFGLFIGIHVIIHIPSAFLRAHRQKEIRRLKREFRR